MRIIGASKLFLCDEDFQILPQGGVAFYEAHEGCENRGRIAEVGSFEALKEHYPGAKAEFYHDSVLLPGLINAHTHLEFSANVSTLKYGSFEEWLSSVLARRELLMEHERVQRSMHAGLSELLKSGTTGIGAISSHGIDLEILASSPLRVCYFNEAIGSNPAALDALFSDFLARIEASKAHKSERFSPAVALHSPYSLHPILAKNALKEAHKLGGVVSAHFLESTEEREWLLEGKGFFEHFFARFLPDSHKPKPLYTPLEFLELFEGFEPILVHGVQMRREELERAASMNATLVSCPRSNRLLGGALLDIAKVRESGLKLAFATDGKSSNYSLSLLDELRIALFAYPKMPLLSWAQELLLGVTRRAAGALKFESGELKSSLWADFALFEVEGIKDSSQEAVQLILHAKEAKALYIAGERII